MTNPDCIKVQREMIVAFERELPKLRKAVGVSQTSFGRKVRVSRQFVSSIERGEAQMAWATYIAAVNFFMANGNKDIHAFINEHVRFVEQYMKDGSGVSNEN